MTLRFIPPDGKPGARFVLICGLLLGLLAHQISCRLPEPELRKRKNVGVIFDTAYRPQSGAASPLLKSLDDVYARYHRTLAEPVAVTYWGDDRSQWRIHFATNRGIDSDPATGQPARPNREVAAQVRYGYSETMVPGRRRGQDPPLASSNKKGFGFLSSAKAEPATDDVARLAEVHETSQAEFLRGIREQIQASTGRDLLLFVHGFNVGFDAAIIRTAQLGLDLPFNGALCCYSWPSQGGISNYSADERANALSVPPFRDFLAGLIQGVPAETRIHILVHSMGNRLVMQSLRELSETPGPIKPIDNLVLCAPDVGLRDFSEWIPGARQLARRVTLYVGDSDTALIASKALHGEQRVGDALPPVIYPGVETVDCSPVEMSFMGHSYYGGNVEVLCDLFSLLKEDHPASKRDWLASQETPAGPFWRFHEQPTPVYFTWNFPDEKRF